MIILYLTVKIINIIKNKRLYTTHNMANKIIYDPSEEHIFSFKGEEKEKFGNIAAIYVPEIPISKNLRKHLDELNFVRVYYKGRFGTVNRTPRLTMTFGQVNPEEKPNMIRYRGLNFMSDPMPRWLNRLSKTCRKYVKATFGFDPEYNSCIIGKYIGPTDQIAFHSDAETFLAHHVCSNVTIGDTRDFQFRLNGNTHEITLQDESLFIFTEVEHALPKRARTPPDAVRYSISFRNMATDIGIGNSFYYCRGFDYAIDDELKEKYIIELEQMIERKK